ncbi:sterol desaturase family protein [uncultured Tateyamaria sp.]|uniref:sterol desaturase family protein n=1 Tax=uncultured Tateyamaria sp. TaxID=455651 RepID=UPI00263355F5|nr:sterol desaturase family protein [uncultured Tateyamaria sp.]
MTLDALDVLGTQIDEVFFFIGIAILLIELAEVLFKGSHKGRTLAEMLVSASTQIPSILIEVFLLTAAYGVYYILADMFVSWQIPLTWWGIALAVIAADFTYYWEHRIAHQVRILWTQHAVHHSSRDYNIITGIRFGPLEGVWSLLAHIPLVFLGFSPDMIFFGIIVVLAYQTWIHTEVIGKMGWFDAVMNSPANHRVHHGSDDKYIDRNYGGITVVWDQLFGTYQAEEETPRYGLKRDFDSRNPLVVWFSEVPGLWRDMVTARTWAEAWRYMVRRPGWSPSADGRE